MKIKLFLTATLLLTSINSYAFWKTKGSFYCHSEMMVPYGEYDKAYIQSNTCDRIEGDYFGDNAKEKASKQCKKWAKGLGINSYDTKFFDENNDEDFHHICRLETRKIEDSLKEKKLNKIERFTKTQTYPGGSSINWSVLYVDNHEDQKTIMYNSESEQAQWIKKDDKIYCGFIKEDIAFLSTAGEYQVLKPSTGETATYVRNDLSKDYDAVSKIPGIEADFLHYSLEQYGHSYMTFFNMVGSYKEIKKKLRIFYSEFRLDCY